MRRNTWFNSSGTTTRLTRPRLGFGYPSFRSHGWWFLGVEAKAWLEMLSRCAYDLWQYGSHLRMSSLTSHHLLPWATRSNDNFLKIMDIRIFSIFIISIAAASTNPICFFDNLHSRECFLNSSDVLDPTVPEDHRELRANNFQTVQLLHDEVMM